MKIIEADVQFVDAPNGEEILKKLELCGRSAYKSEDKITQDSAERFIRNILNRGHESVIEHVSLTLKFICDRGVSHEIVRHRLASYTQESTRYCNYGNDKYGNEITVIKPCFFNDIDHEKVMLSVTNPIEEYPSLSKRELAYNAWFDSCRRAEQNYFRMLNYGCSPQEARSVLPNSLKTEVIMTADLREWRHFFQLRCDPAAHPQMREVALKALRLMHKAIPVVFDDLAEKFL